MKDERQYQNVYYRIEAGYVWGEGMDESKSELLHDELKAIFLPMGFIEQPKTISAASPEFARDSESLYCHPMGFSGYLLKDNIPIIQNVLEQAKTFKWTRTDSYETVLNYTPDELLMALQEKTAETTTAILDAFKTKRKNLYKAQRLIWGIKSNIGFFNTNENKAIEQKFIIDVFNGLIQQKLLTESEGKPGKIYRTAV